MGWGNTSFQYYVYCSTLQKKKYEKKCFGFKCSIIAITTLCEFLHVLKLRLMKRILDKIILMPNILRLQI